jgi:hypothetical protein
MLKTSERPQIHMGFLLTLSTLIVDLRTVLGIKRYGDKGVMFCLEGGSTMTEQDTLKPGDHEMILTAWVKAKFPAVTLDIVPDECPKDIHEAAALFKRTYSKSITVPMVTNVGQFNSLEWRNGPDRLYLRDSNQTPSHNTSDGVWFSVYSVEALPHGMSDDDKEALRNAVRETLPTLHAALKVTLAGA